jgi:hypothetical protein
MVRGLAASRSSSRVARVEAGAMLIAEPPSDWGGWSRIRPPGPFQDDSRLRHRCLILLIALLSSALLPSWNILLLTLVVMLVFSVFFTAGP